MIRLVTDLPRTFVRHFRQFRRYTGKHMFALTALNVLMSWSEGIGLALFFPLLGDDQDNNALSAAFRSVLDFLGIAATPAAVLPLIIGVFVLKGVLTFVTQSYQGYLAAQLPLALRREIIDSLQRADYRTVQAANTGFVTNLLVNEVNKVDAGFVAFVRTFPPTLNITVFFAIVLWLDWRLTLLCGAMGLCAIAIIGITGRIAALASQVLMQENGKLSSLLIQMVQAFKYLRTTAGLGVFANRIGASAERSARAVVRNYSASALSQSLAQPLMVILLAGILYYQAVIQNEPLGPLFVLLLYFFRIMTELWALQYNWQTFISYHGPIELVYESVAKYRGAAEHRGSQPYKALQSAIELRDVSFAYEPGRDVLRKIDLQIPRNTTVAFVGESGAGKSTLVDLILGTLKPTAGHITYDGTSLADLDIETLRAHVGYVPQDAMLFDDTLGNNIALWSSATEAAILEAAARAKCSEFIAAMPAGLATELGDRGVRLSGGQRQRIAIARELLKRPEILVLDEATSALDSESERAIQQSIDALQGQLTLIIIAHRLSTIRNCKHICVIHGGTIVESGSYDELVATPGSRFQRLVQLQELTRSVQAP